MIIEISEYFHFLYMQDSRGHLSLLDSSLLRYCLLCYLQGERQLFPVPLSQKRNIFLLMLFIIVTDCKWWLCASRNRLLSDLAISAFSCTTKYFSTTCFSVGAQGPQREGATVFMEFCAPTSFRPLAPCVFPLRSTEYTPLMFLIFPMKWFPSSLSSPSPASDVFACGRISRVTRLIMGCLLGETSLDGYRVSLLPWYRYRVINFLSFS